ncbi:MAG: 50S ribosomal protein L3 N(5)-glutamine methyltransferase [Nevskiaceae bacterium]|nr:MAG: 50S ribosomal protein L3 N(5)-glutamine methyltransferase [Nevskiaceae bacterium]TBR74681.1 MAG: 50S ribosomal protein L3 N(5)-glutamine methyltransferase [Nevskiaceae bacterium]
MTVALETEWAALHSIRDWVRWGASAFERAGLVYGHGTDNALDEAFQLVLWVLKLPFDLPERYFAATLTASECAAVHALLQKRIATRKPAPYLTGKAWFAGLSFEVDERVLVPRSPTAELVEAGFAPWLSTAPDTILDLCAGSGCIGIACAVAFPAATVDLADVDAGALALSTRNVQRHGLAERVRVVASDLYTALGDCRYDLIISNPPYVPAAECDALAPEYATEPRAALDGGADGMDLVARILSGAPEHLAQHGTLVCEIGGSRNEFEARFPEFPGLWPEFERGGDGVFVITRSELVDWHTSHPVESDVR